MVNGSLRIKAKEIKKSLSKLKGVYKDNNSNHHNSKKSKSLDDDMSFNKGGSKDANHGMGMNGMGVPCMNGMNGMGMMMMVPGGAMNMGGSQGNVNQQVWFLFCMLVLYQFFMFYASPRYQISCYVSFYIIISL